MREYSPKRRTALVLTGACGSGAYHAGVLQALDESGVRVDVLVGSGAGTVGAAFGAVMGGGRLYGAGGFWERASYAGFYRTRPDLRAMGLLLAVLFGVVLLPVALALLGGLLFPFYLAADWLAPEWAAWLAGRIRAAWPVLRAAYFASLIALLFVLSLTAVVFAVATVRRYGQRYPEAFESLLTAGGARRVLAHGLWEVVRGAAISSRPPSEAELSRRYVALLRENLGQPGFRELVLRTADLDTGRPLPFVLLADAHAGSFRAPGAKSDGDRRTAKGGVNLLEEGNDALFFEAAATGLMPPVATPLCRVRFPKGSPWAGETHRLTDATVGGGSGLSEALAVGAEQVIVVTAVPESAGHPARRRGPHATASAVLATLERQAVEDDLRQAERINRMVHTLGHRTDRGVRAWQDPATGRLYQDVALYVIRPHDRTVDPLGLDGIVDPATEVVESLGDLAERGYRDAYRQFLEPVVGAGTEARRAEAVPSEEGQHVEL